MANPVSKFTFFRIAEWVLCIICLILHVVQHTLDFDTETISSIAFGGFLILTFISGLGLLFLTPFDIYCELIHLFLGGALFITAGVLNFDIFIHWSSRGGGNALGIITAILAICTGVLYLVDFVFYIKEQFFCKKK